MEYFLKGEHKRLWETVGTKLQAWCIAWLEKNMLTRFSDYQASLCLDQLKRKILKERIRELQEYAFDYPYESSFACDYAKKVSKNQLFCTDCPLAGLDAFLNCYETNGQGTGLKPGILQDVLDTIKSGNYDQAVEYCNTIAAVEVKEGVLYVEN